MQYIYIYIYLCKFIYILGMHKNNVVFCLLCFLHCNVSKISDFFFLFHL